MLEGSFDLIHFIPKSKR